MLGCSGYVLPECQQIHVHRIFFFYKVLLLQQWIQRTMVSIHTILSALYTLSV